MATKDQYEASLKERIEGMVREAYEDGYVFTVSLEPKTPLAMGNYNLKVDVREKRVLATPIVRVANHNEFAVIRNEQAAKDQQNQPFIIHTYTGGVPIPPARQAFFTIVDILNKSRGVNIVLSDKHVDEGEGYLAALMRDGFTPTKTNLWALLTEKNMIPRSPAYQNLHSLLDALYDNS